MKRSAFALVLVLVAMGGWQGSLLYGAEATNTPAAEGTAGQDAARGEHSAAAAAAAGAPALERFGPPLVAQPVRELMQDGKYEAAIAAIDEAMQSAGAPQDYLTYLKGRALYLKGDYDAAIAQFDRFAETFVQSDWGRRARFGKALALARRGDFRSAELIYRAEAEYLLSEDRRQEIAGIYLEFADRYFDPPGEDEKPDYQKALEFYQKALEVGPLPEKRAEVELLVAECLQNLGKYGEAAAGYRKFIAEHPDSRLDIEARYCLGQCLLAEGNRREARRCWQDLLAKYPGAQEERLAEAAFELCRTWNIPEPQSDEELSLGTAALEAFVERFPDHKLASQAFLESARSFIYRGRHEEAAAALRRLLESPRYGQREEIPDARDLLGQCYLLQKKFAEALAAWQEYLAKHPTHKQWSEVQRRIIDAEYLMAAERKEAKQYDEARKLWEEFLAKHPLDDRCRGILLLFGQMNYEQEKWLEAMADWRRLVSKYPQSDEASQAQYAIASTLEWKLGRLEEALEEYKKVSWGSHQAAAQEAIVRLTARTMSVVTERVFRSDEVPRLRLSTRNIEKVTVRAYLIDMETYFRKMHLARGVEGLDIALIDPNESFEFTIPHYQKYQELESWVEVPLPGGLTGGVMAVTVSSSLLEATTMVIQSDLDVIVKSSRAEVLVFAENMLTGKPWPGVRLLISDGSRVFAEATTGADGVWHKAYEELKQCGDVRVFAIAGANVASNVVDLQGLGVARGLTDKGYIYTDRPAYRPGQVVHVRGCLRKAADDTYVVEEGKQFTLDIFDGRNRQIEQQQVTLDRFGTFHAHFLLPAASPQGQYRALVRDKDGRSFQGTFQVIEYQLESVYLTIDTPRSVYYRGEEIEGTIRAAYYYGAPLAGREIRYQLASEPVETATTDEKGEVKFKLATRDFSETQVLPLVVTLPERNLSVAKNLVLATQGFALAVSTIRPVYVAGESFEVTVTATDAEGKPTAQKITLKVMERTQVDGRRGERLVEEHALETSPEDGTARQTLKLEAGGEYILRATGTDRFANPIFGQHQVLISDEEDKVRLRILADRHSYKVGDTAEVTLHWREQPALALVAFQGARVLDYQLLTLKKGANKLKIPMTADLAPNFELAVAVMTDPRPDRLLRSGPATEPPPAAASGKGAEPAKAASAMQPETVTAAGASQAEQSSAVATPPAGSEKHKGPSEPPKRFHLASSPFQVERQLRVGLVVRRKGAPDAPIRPGDELEVAITTTDPQGKPVSAELSLALVEQALLDRFAWDVPAIQDFFRGELRQAAVRTTSSIIFAYRPATRPINPRLLAERERLELAREEEASRLAALAGGGLGGMSSLAAGELVPGAPPPADGFFSSRAMAADQQVLEPPMLDLLAEDADAEELVIHSETGDLANQPGRPDEPGTGQGRRRMLVRRYGGALATQSEKQQAAQGGQAGFAPDGWGYYSRLGQWHERAQTTGRTFDEYALVTNGVLSLYRIPPDRLHSFAAEAGGQITVLDASGNMQQFKLRTEGPAAAQQTQELLAQLAEAGAAILPGAVPQETGYWNPAVVTDEQGQATLTLLVPERSTAWQLAARGITTETLAGQAEEKLVVKKELFGQLKLPPAFTDGDRAEVEVSVHNDLLSEGEIEVRLKTTIGQRTVEDVKRLKVTAKGIVEASFPVELRMPQAAEPAQAAGASVGAGADAAADEGADSGEATGAAGGSAAGSAPKADVVFELFVTAAGQQDVTRRSVPLLPHGMPVFATVSGSATSDTTAWVEPPEGMTFARPGLEILVGPTVEQSLLDILLAPPPWCQLEARRYATGLDAAASDLMAGLALQELLAGTHQAGGPQAAALDGRIRAAVGLLVSSQRDDGSWSWTGRGAQGERYPTARIVWALSLARKAGYLVPDDCYNKALAYLRSQVAATSESDYETKAVLLHALSAAGEGDFALANRLYRNRPALSTAALAYLALAFAEMDRQPTAQELVDLLAERDLDQPGTRREASSGCLPWNQSPVELRALYCLTLEAIAPQDARIKPLVDWLLAHRTGHRWMPDQATGPAALAAARYFARTRFEGEHYRLEIFVNDVQVAVLEMEQDSGTRVVDVPARLLKKEGKQRINFRITGRGRYTYQCIFGGFVPAEKLQSTTPDWRVERFYEPARLEVDGREIGRGFGAVEGSYTSFRNPLTQLPVGRRGMVELDVRRNVRSDTPTEQIEYLVLVEPLPAGATVIERSVSGAFERFEITPGAIIFYLGSRPHGGVIRYELYGYLPGAYRAGPTMVRDAHRLDRMAIAAPKSLAVLAAGSESADAYRLTPQELYELGKLEFDKGRMAEAGKHLTELVEKWNLRPEVYKHAVQMLLDVHLATGPAAKVVHYFEIIKEKWPTEEIPFAKILKIGAAYHEMGEYERSYLIFRATVEGSFLVESRVAGFLQSQGEFVRSVEVMDRLLREYPPEGYVAAAAYALAQRVYAKAPEAAQDAKLRAQKINRVDLVRRAWEMLESFLTAWPEDPAADQAAFAAANALLELEAYDQAAAAAQRYAERYAKSDLLDSFWYVIAYCRFALGEHQAALEMCHKVAEAKRVDPLSGREVEARNKWQAIYILGQIHHSLGAAAQAIEQYQRVADRFPDARQSIEYFTRKAISLPEVTTVRPGAPVEVELSFRNVAACDVKVYRIDLMKFSLLKRDLAGITQINLAGIRPYFETALELGDGKDYRDRTHRFGLPLEDEGAYLIVCRGESLHTSGLVLVTPLQVEVQEDAVSGRVRTTVKDAVADRFLSNVHVKVIGSANEDFVAGQTDLRGVFVADGISGTTTVIAQAEGPRYAFFRGTTPLALEAAEAKRAEKAKTPEAAPAASPEGELLRGLMEQNRGFQGQQVKQLEQMYENIRGGLAPSEAF